MKELKNAETAFPRLETGCVDSVTDIRFEMKFFSQPTANDYG